MISVATLVMAVKLLVLLVTALVLC